MSALAVIVSLVPAAPALASPTPAEVKAEIAAQNRALEPIIEQYNGIRAKLADDQAKSKTISTQLGPIKLKATIARERLGEIANSFYQAGQISPAQSLFATEDTNDLLFLLGSLNEVARQQAAAIDAAAKVVTDYKSKASALSKLILVEKQQFAELNKKKATITAKVASLQKLLAEANAAAAAAAAASSSGSTSTSSGATYTKSQLMPAACPTSSTGKGHTAAVKACSLVWTAGRNPPWRMYGWADAGPDTYDCSGLTMVAWEAAGIQLQHYTGSQWNESYSISSSQLRPGDLVFYFTAHSHVAIYVGGGWIVQAEETGQPLKMSHIDFTGPRYYRRVNGT